ncbi:MAG: energy transducer TonB [Treponema sp.]|jgi:protein TonB|nr:energy transducer TonB [Treponema sp.]
MMNRLRILLVVLVAAAHGLAILYISFDAGRAAGETEERARVMKLIDIAEYIPPPPAALPPPPPQEAPPPDNAVEAIAEEMIESAEEPENQTLVEAGSITAPPLSGPSGQEEEYLPAHKISVLPEFPNAAILAALKYPPIAKRSNIEGRVILDLFIDRAGIVRQIDILREDPPNRGFGDAAAAAVREALRNPGNRCKPALANGEPVSARVRYPVSFRLR